LYDAGANSVTKIVQNIGESRKKKKPTWVALQRRTYDVGCGMRDFLQMLCCAARLHFNKWQTAFVAGAVSEANRDGAFAGIETLVPRNDFALAAVHGA
jgi:hypothetical protein